VFGKAFQGLGPNDLVSEKDALQGNLLGSLAEHDVIQV